MAVLPFLLKPTGKDYLWGGNRLNEDFGKNINMYPLAETWECSTHPDGLSYVASGEFEGLSLRMVLKEHPEYLGRFANPDGELPILVKFIDAKQDLSLQVHPSDEYAYEHENGQKGKTEMWYVLDAKQDARLIYGFAIDVSADKLRESIGDGSVEKFLQRVSVSKDDVFLINSGTVHAIGEGVLIAEIQENSNLTYRMYDYNRVDKDGNKRRLDIDKAIDVANMKAVSAPRQPMRVLRYRPGIASELLCRCKYFQTERILVNTQRCRNMAEISTMSDTFQVLLCISGGGILYYGNEYSLNFFAGDCIFVPSGCEDGIKLHGRGTFLKVTC